MFNLSEALRKYPVCQKRTGKTKQFTIMVDDKIYKGPYQPQRLKNLTERSTFFRKNGTPLVILPLMNPDGSIQIHQSEAGPFLTYPNLAHGYPVVCQPH